eukprot:g91.t1
MVSLVDGVLRRLQEEIAGNSKLKKHRSMKRTLPWNERGCSVGDLRLFLEELMSQQGATEPIVQSGGIYGVSSQFDELNASLIIHQLQNDGRFAVLSSENVRRANGFFRTIFGNRHLRNRNPLHFCVVDCCLISNVLNVPRQIFGLPYACFATDGLESLSLCLFAYKKRSDVQDRLRSIVLYRCATRRLESEVADCCKRLGIDARTWSASSQIERERCVAVVAGGLSGIELRHLAGEAEQEGVPVHVHVTDRQFRGIFLNNASMVHLELPAGVSSVSIEDGMLTSGYSLYRDPALRDMHMDVAMLWQTLYLSPNEGGSGSCRPIFVDLCLWLLGWTALAHIAEHGFEVTTTDSRQNVYDVVDIQRNEKGVRERSASWDKRDFAGILRHGKNMIVEANRTDLIRDFVFFQRAFVGGMSRDVLEASITGGGTRSINMAFEAVLRRAKRSWNGTGLPRVITGNPHLAVERAERRFGFLVVRVAKTGVISTKRLEEELQHPDVVAVYSQSLSYTDGTSDPVPEIVDILEKHNRRRLAAGAHAVAHINDCCLAFNVLLNNDGSDSSSGACMRVLDYNTKYTPTMVTIDAHKHMGAEKGISTVFGTLGTLSALDGSLRVGAEPSKGDLVRTLANLHLIGVDGYCRLYRRVDAAVSKAIGRLREAGLRLVRPFNRRAGSTVLCFEDPSGAVGRIVNRSGYYVGSVYNLHDTCSLERSATSASAWQLSVTPHSLRPVPRGSDGSGIALDLFVDAAIDAHRVVANSVARRVVRSLCSERSLLAHAVADNMPIYVFSKIAGGGLAESAGVTLARRYCTPVLDGGKLFCRNETLKMMNAALARLAALALVATVAFAFCFYTDATFKQLGYVAIALLLLERWGAFAVSAGE